MKKNMKKNMKAMKILAGIILNKILLIQNKWKK